MDDALVIAGKRFSSRLMLGTGRYRTMEEQNAAIAASGCEIITVAIRRLNLDDPNEKTLLDFIDWDRYQILPNTAGARNVEEAVFTARLARRLCEQLGGESNWVKLEVQPDPASLLPDPIDTLRAAEQLIAEGFVVLPYIGADPLLAKRLEEAGCATVMPLGSPIGSGQGILTREEIQLIVAQAKVPVVVDAGLGTPSDAAQAMEIGADAVLINSAVALARNPETMAHAMKLGVEAGRAALLAGRMPRRELAAASSPTEGVPAHA
jgi:thiazole synthase